MALTRLTNEAATEELKAPMTVGLSSSQRYICSRRTMINVGSVLSLQRMAAYLKGIFTKTVAAIKGFCRSIEAQTQPAIKSTRMTANPDQRKLDLRLVDARIR
jgi:hypothetical protein